MATPIGVAELCTHIKSKLRTVTGAVVLGVVGRVHVASSGHSYFDLSDGQERISCVVFSSEDEVREGQATVHVRRCDLYAGRCQAIVSRVVHGESEAPSQRDALMAKLALEGVLHRPRLPLPGHVECLCLVTSRRSAAAADMLRCVEERWPGLRVVLVDVLVQGTRAPEGLCAALRMAKQQVRPDVIVCARGGGAEGDLAAFDDERVARACISDSIPIVVAVGHESDHAVAEAVADLRAKTPTAAIHAVLPRTRTETVQHARALRQRSSTRVFALCNRAAARVHRARQQSSLAFGAVLRRAETSVTDIRSRLGLESLLRRARGNVCRRRQEATLGFRLAYKTAHLRALHVRAASAQRVVQLLDITRRR